MEMVLNPKPPPSSYLLDTSDSSDSEDKFGQMPNKETAYISDNRDQSPRDTKQTDKTACYLRIKQVVESKFCTVINS